MKSICISMNKTEEVLDSYLIRVCNGRLRVGDHTKIVSFPEINLNLKNKWDLRRFKDFCELTVSDKRSLKMYKARLVPKKEEQNVNS